AGPAPPPAAPTRTLVPPAHPTTPPPPTRPAPAGVSVTFQRPEPWERSAARRPVSTAVRGGGAARPPLVLSPRAGGPARPPLVLSPCPPDTTVVRTPQPRATGRHGCPNTRRPPDAATVTTMLPTRQ